MADDAHREVTKAGEAYRKAAKNDPQSQRARLRLQALAASILVVGEKLGPLIRESSSYNFPEIIARLRALIENDPAQQKPDSDLRQLLAETEATYRDFLIEVAKRKTAEQLQQQAFFALGEAIQESIHSTDTELEALGFDPPGLDMDKWEQLARIVEKDPGPMTINEIYQWTIAWVQREKMRLKLAQAVRVSNEVRERSPDRTDRKPAITTKEEERLFSQWTTRRVTQPALTYREFAKELGLGKQEVGQIIQRVRKRRRRAKKRQ